MGRSVIQVMSFCDENRLMLQDSINEAIIANSLDVVDIKYSVEISGSSYKELGYNHVHYALVLYRLNEVVDVKKGV